MSMRGIIRILQSFRGDQVNVIMIEVKSYGPHFPGDE